MAPIPKPQAHTVKAIYDAYRDSNESWDSLGISVGDLGHECDRYLYANLRWVSAPEIPEGRNVSIFRTGDYWEERLIGDLAAIGVEVMGQQDKIRLVGGHVRGKIDGRATGFPEAPKTEHLCEFKSAKASSYRSTVKHGVVKDKPQHYGQCQIGMHAFGLTRAAYLVVNKDTDERHMERVPYDAGYCARTLARAERIVNADAPPSKVRDTPDAPPCLFCRHKPFCFGSQLPRATCRSCVHASPEMGRDALWSCARWNKPLSIDEQKAACPAHLYDPELVPGEVLSVDEQAETITYRMASGETWTDGAATNATEEN